MDIQFKYPAGPAAHAWAHLYGAAARDPLPPLIAMAPAGLDAYLRLLYRGDPPEVANPLQIRS